MAHIFLRRPQYRCCSGRFLSRRFLDAALGRSCLSQRTRWRCEGLLCKTRDVRLTSDRNRATHRVGFLLFLFVLMCLSSRLSGLHRKSITILVEATHCFRHCLGLRFRRFLGRCGRLGDCGWFCDAYRRRRDFGSLWAWHDARCWRSLERKDVTDQRSRVRKERAIYRVRLGVRVGGRRVVTRGCSRHSNSTIVTLRYSDRPMNNRVGIHKSLFSRLDT